MDKELTVTYGDITVFYRGALDGGGTTFGQEYIPVVKRRFGHVDHVFEFCAGPGFIGFALLAAGLCDRLTLADINPEAVALCRKTVAHNGLEDRVSVYESDVLKAVPPEERWDLVVGNPPHFVAKSEEEYQGYIRRFDPNLRIHQEFYSQINAHLAQNGSVLLQENAEGMKPEVFREMVEANGFVIKEVYNASTEERTEARSLSLKNPRPRPNYRKLADPFAVFKYVRGWITRALRTQNPFYFIHVVRRGE